MSTQPLQYTQAQKIQGKASFFATKPTRFTVFWRTFLPWQVWRFIAINLKMFAIIYRSHKSQ